MIEVRLNRYLCLEGRHRHERRILDLLDEVFVALRHEASSLLDIQINIVAPEHHTRDIRGVHVEITSGIRQHGGIVEQGIERRNGDIDTDRVVLKGEERKIETWIAAEVELEGDEKLEAWTERTRDEIGNHVGVHAADHVVGRLLLRGGSDELLPDLHPFTGLLVDLLLADLEGDLLNEGVSDAVHIGYGIPREVYESGENDVEVDFAEEISTAWNET